MSGDLLAIGLFNDDDDDVIAAAIDDRVYEGGKGRPRVRDIREKQRGGGGTLYCATRCVHAYRLERNGQAKNGLQNIIRQAAVLISTNFTPFLPQDTKKKNGSNTQ